VRIVARTRPVAQGISLIFPAEPLVASGGLSRIQLTPADLLHRPLSSGSPRRPAQTRGVGSWFARYARPRRATEMIGMKGPESAMIEVHELHPTVRGLAVASFGMSFFALAVFWWIPFGFLVGGAATALAVLSMILGVRTRARGLYYALGGIALAGTAATMALLTSKLHSWLFVEF
jgi:hypothetical protein